jgi:hypothetical protein
MLNLNAFEIDETRTRSGVTEIITQRLVPWAEAPWTEAELEALFQSEPLTGAEIVARGLLGGWEDKGITDPVAWVEALRGRRQQRWD